MEHGHWITQIGSHTLTFNSDTLITMWAAMLFMIIIAFLTTRKLDIIPNKLQVIFEEILGFFWSMTDSLMGEKEGRKHIPLIASLFFFILIANLMGQIPFKIIELKQGEIASPTNDINLTAAMAVIVLIYYVCVGIKKKKFKYFLHDFSPISIFMFFLELLEMVTRPLTLALRLFGNIMAGEILITSMLGFFAYILPLPFMFLELLVAVIQALVFSMLTLVYITNAVQEE